MTYPNLVSAFTKKYKPKIINPTRRGVTSAELLGSAVSPRIREIEASNHHRRPPTINIGSYIDTELHTKLLSGENAAATRYPRPVNPDARYHSESSLMPVERVAFWVIRALWNTDAKTTVMSGLQPSTSSQSA